MTPTHVVVTATWSCCAHIRIRDPTLLFVHCMYVLLFCGDFGVTLRKEESSVGKDEMMLLLADSTLS